MGAVLPASPGLGQRTPRVYTKYASDPGPKSNRIGSAQSSRPTATSSVPIGNTDLPGLGRARGDADVADLLRARRHQRDVARLLERAPPATAARRGCETKQVRPLMWTMRWPLGPGSSVTRTLACRACRRGRRRRVGDHHEVHAAIADAACGVSDSSRRCAFAPALAIGALAVVIHGWTRVGGVHSGCGVGSEGLGGSADAPAARRHGRHRRRRRPLRVSSSRAGRRPASRVDGDDRLATASAARSARSGWPRWPAATPLLGRRLDRPS